MLPPSAFLGMTLPSMDRLLHELGRVDQRLAHAIELSPLLRRPVVQRGEVFLQATQLAQLGLQRGHAPQANILTQRHAAQIAAGGGHGGVGQVADPRKLLLRHLAVHDAGALGHG
uniref:Uncharacterized protein n=1 Tax=mine drainage metagenome TaxID=410659 RepID=E6PNI0_9ZZZZ